MPYDQRFEVRCDEEWRAVLRRVAERMRASETEAARGAVMLADQMELTDCPGKWDEQKEPA